MCGIVGYIGSKDSTKVVLEGLKMLEYRGYDSSGISIYDGKKIVLKKFKGRLSVLSDYLKNNPLKGKIALGHTRWATHGEPSDRNSHPHLSADGNFAVVHNGIIENYLELKEDLINKGYEFKSDTDTEVIAHLFEELFTGDLLDTAFKVVKKIKGAYAAGVISSLDPNKIVALRKESPLVIGIGEGENFIASDVPALLPYTKKVIYANDGDIALITSDEVRVFDSLGSLVDRKIDEIKWTLDAATKSGYPHFMLKEIFEQPLALKNTFERRLNDKGKLKLDDIKIDKKYLEGIDKIYVVACGTAYHAGLVGKHLFEKYLDIEVEVEIASEFRYKKNFVTDKTLVIIVSQSGETLDTLMALKSSKEKCARILAITNVVGSSVAREADDVVYTWAGPEIAVASTKAYTTQLMVFYMLMLDFGFKLGKLNSFEYEKMVKSLKKEYKYIEDILRSKSKIKKISSSFIKIKDAFYLGRTFDYYLALEGSLKLKEISYIHTEAFPSGELKHGPISLIEKGTVVIFISTVKDLSEKTLSNLREVKARGANTVVIANKGCNIFEGTADTIFEVKGKDEFACFEVAAIMQLLAYYTSTLKGIDVDKPRNLAKSVTVE